MAAVFQDCSSASHAQHPEAACHPPQSEQVVSRVRVKGGELQHTLSGCALENHCCDSQLTTLDRRAVPPDTPQGWTLPHPVAKSAASSSIDTRSSSDIFKPVRRPSLPGTAPRWLKVSARAAVGVLPGPKYSKPWTAALPAAWFASACHKQGGCGMV